MVNTVLACKSLWCKISNCISQTLHDAHGLGLVPCSLPFVLSSFCNWTGKQDYISQPAVMAYSGSCKCHHLLTAKIRSTNIATHLHTYPHQSELATSSPEQYGLQLKLQGELYTETKTKLSGG